MSTTLGNSQNSLFLLGQERLKLIGKHASILMQGYIDGEINDTALSENELIKLTQARIIHRADDYSPLTIKSVVSELIASLVQDERKRQINADVAEHLDQIRTKVDAIHAARAKMDFPASEHYMQLLSERVHDMSGQFGETIESLWHRLNTEFGFVSSLDDKIREIELAQKQLRRLLDGFAVIDFDEMIELAGSDSSLRKLLVSQLQAKISEHSGSLLEVQKRLVLLMTRFRQQQERTLLISRMSAFLRQHPNFTVGDYANRTKVPAIVNQAAGMTVAVAIGLDRPQDNDALSELARAIERPTFVEKPAEVTQTLTVKPQTLVATAQKQLAADVENFFIEVIDKGQANSALAYLEDNQLQWDREIWLFQVIAEYEGMKSSEKQAFRMEKISQPIHVFNQVKVIQDVHLGMNMLGELV